MAAALTKNRLMDEAKRLLKQFLCAQKNLGVSDIPISKKSLKVLIESADVAIDEDVMGKKREVVNEPELIDLPAGSKDDKWHFLKNLVLSCHECTKHVKPGKHIVFGSGNLDADIFFCGEAPGAEEEDQGEVFVGKAGKLLTKIIEAMGLTRSEVYIGNIMNWRPETPNMIGNRPPTQEEMQFCLPYLLGQIEIVKPKVIVALGATAVNGLLGYDSTRRMRDIRGSFMDFQNSKMIITYHPSYLLRNQTNEAKRIVWEDMLSVMKFLKMPISPQQQNYFL